MSEIRRLGKNPTPTRSQPTILGTHEVKETAPQVLDRNSTAQQSPAEVVRHEEIKVEGEDKIRQRKSDGGLDLRFREGKSRAEWERVKRMED